MNLFNKEHSLWLYRFLLIFATMIWGFGFNIAKDAIEVAGATWVIGIRFLGAGLIMLVFLFPHIKRHMSRDLFKAGVIISVFSFLGFWTQFVGLGMTTASKNAFLSACYCVTAPFIVWMVMRKKPSRRVMVAALVCAAGIGFVSLNEGDFSISLGDGISILSAFLYGTEIVVIDIFLKDHDILAITTIQMVSCGILGCLLALFTQPIPSADQVLSLRFIGDMAYIVLLSALFGSTVQNLAQAHISAAETGVICSLESVFCAICSVAFFGESLTLKLVVGFVLIFAAVVATTTEKEQP